ncbi:hypothetical protein JL100_023020 [Skermanella mucosa]|uniref:hypothetical protein n=1 Tax=Skermanella mucosa TaxID=1789672 RepID=UPI00192A7646|nr:hypothetical protein [Skermanella mucosa]UEM19927.1 hypothetical protein JL100_023020 [Skermanella mucosa]
MSTFFPGALFARHLERHPEWASDLIGAVYDDGADEDGFPIRGAEDGALVVETPAGPRRIVFRALAIGGIDCCTPPSLALANRLRHAERLLADANWFGAYARFAGLREGDPVDAEHRDRVVARMKARLDATMPKASEALADRAPGFLLDLCSTLFSIDQGRPFGTEAALKLARALQDSACKPVAAKLYLAVYRAEGNKWVLAEAASTLRAIPLYQDLDRLEAEIEPPAAERDRPAAAAVLTSIAAGHRERGRLVDALRVIRKARTYGTSDHLLNVLRAIEADIAKG